MGLFGKELLIYLRGNFKVIFSCGEILPWTVCLPLPCQTLLSSYFPVWTLLNSLDGIFFSKINWEKNLSQAYSFLNLPCSSSVVKVLNMKPCSPIYSLAKSVCSMSISWVVSPSGWGWFLFVLSSTELLGRTPSKRIKQHYHLQRGNHLLHLKRGHLFSMLLLSIASI